MYKWVLIRKVVSISSLVLLSVLPLMADKNNNETQPIKDHTPIPNVPEFSITYLNETLSCSPIEVIKKKTHKDLVTYECQRESQAYAIEKKRDEERGHAEAQRLNADVKNKISQGTIYTVEIPLQVAKNPSKASIIAQRQLNNKPYGKYLHMLLPAKLYMSIRPQLINSGDNGELKLHNGGSKGGFFYYHQFNNDLELIFQYEASMDWDKDTNFINTSDTSNTNRRLSYFALKYQENSIILGKYWSAYYDIAGFTDQYMTFGGLASGAFSGGPHGTPSGTGRADKMIQVRTKKDTYDATLQVQFRHDAFRDWHTDYTYTMSGSLVYKGWEDIKVGVSLAYGEFDEITPEMQVDRIDGNDLSSIIGLNYKNNNFSSNAVFSYMKNHVSDDQGVYFDSMGAELYMQYDIDDSFRLAGGGNWLFSTDNDYDGKYRINNLIFSLQYTFGEKTFDDLAYVEVSLPNGRLANGDSKDASIAIGLRYLLDY